MNQRRIRAASAKVRADEARGRDQRSAMGAFSEEQAALTIVEFIRRAAQDARRQRRYLRSAFGLDVLRGRFRGQVRGLNINERGDLIQAIWKWYFHTLRYQLLHSTATEALRRKLPMVGVLQVMWDEQVRLLEIFQPAAAYYIPLLQGSDAVAIENISGWLLTKIKSYPRRIKCLHCGLDLHADRNAAMNIKARAEQSDGLMYQAEQVAA